MRPCVTTDLRRLINVVRSTVKDGQSVTPNEGRRLCLSTSFRHPLRYLLRLKARDRMKASRLSTILNVISNVRVRMTSSVLHSVQLAVSSTRHLIVDHNNNVKLRVLCRMILFLLTMVLLTVSVLSTCLIPRLRRSLLRNVRLTTISTAIRVIPFTCRLYAFCVVINGIRTTNVNCLSISSGGLTIITIRGNVRP